ncbi:cyclin-dependent kinase 1-like [Hydractinia symbiolongicarpus]|uniref:cyclin-dependent kinase 1-like n=1 Tax=Hydractinia symbiolongicarpus TaxID=13093 RepID=UPI00254D9892|nr:cyclin-dependent kinase 1-like [Hydractinia symbiolongicarpus]
MAGFSFSSSKSITQMEEKVKHLEIPNIPLNISEDMIIGEGSSAIVFKHKIRDKIAAVKKFKQILSKKQLLKAACSLRQLHPYVVRFRSYSVRPSTLAFEYCEVLCQDEVVHNLKELLTVFNDHEYMVLRERTNYAAQACQGILYLHQKGIIHKDIKATNMLVDGQLSDIVVKVADFNEVSAFKDTCTSNITNNSLKGGFHFLLDFKCSYSVPHQIRKICGKIYNWQIFSSLEEIDDVKVVKT